MVFGTCGKKGHFCSDLSHLARSCIMYNYSSMYQTFLKHRSVWDIDGYIYIVSRPDIWLDPPKEKPFGWTETRHKKFAWELPFLILQHTWNGWTEHFKTGFLDHRLMFCFHDYGRKGWDVSLDFCGLWHVIVSQVWENEHGRWQYWICEVWFA